MDKYSKVGLAFLAGAAAGAIAGVLLAPDKGTETRKKISGKAKELGEAITGKAHDGFRFAGNVQERLAKEYVD